MIASATSAWAFEALVTHIPRKEKVEVPEHLQATSHLLEKLTPTQQRVYTIRMSSDPPKTAREVATILDMSVGNVGAIWAKIRERIGFDPLAKWKESGQHPNHTAGNERNDADIIALRNVTPDVLVKLNEMSQEKLLRRLFHNVDDVPVERIPAMIRDMTGARALVKGEPTQILQVNQRENLHKFFPLVVKELEKRGLMIDGEGVKKVPKTIESEPVAADT